jgi:hypothetical protein
LQGNLSSLPLLPPIVVLTAIVSLAYLSQDFASSQESSSTIDCSPLNGWYALQNLLGSLDVLFSTLSQVLLLINLTLLPGFSDSAALNSDVAAPFASVGNATTSTNGVSSPERRAVLTNSIIVLVLCLAWPVVNRVLKRNLDGMCMYTFFLKTAFSLTCIANSSTTCTAYITHINNPHYLRAKSLYDLATGSGTKRKVVSGTMSEYIYRGARPCVCCSYREYDSPRARWDQNTSRPVRCSGRSRTSIHPRCTRPSARRCPPLRSACSMTCRWYVFFLSPVRRG